MALRAFGNHKKINTGLTTTVIRLRLRHHMLEKGIGPCAPTRMISSEGWIRAPCCVFTITQEIVPRVLETGCNPVLLVFVSMNYSFPWCIETKQNTHLIIVLFKLLETENINFLMHQKEFQPWFAHVCRWCKDQVIFCSISHLPFDIFYYILILETGVH